MHPGERVNHGDVTSPTSNDRGTNVAALVATMLLSAALVLPRVVWAPLLDDPGEYQVCAAVGGIGHPPGHAGLVTLMRVFVLLSPAPPHLTVSAVNALFALGVLSILMWLMLRLDADPLPATVVTLLFLIDDQFWHASVVTEVYATCMILLAGSVWAFFSWIDNGRFWKLAVAVFLFFYVASNRAPTVVLGLAFVAAILVDRDARQRLRAIGWRRALLLLILAVIPPAIVLVSVWVRDVPGTPYNYLDLVHPVLPYFPPSNTSLGDKLQRMWWLISARQFDYMFHPTGRTMKGQGIWLMTEFGRRYWMFTWPVMLAALAVVVIGGRVLWQRHRTIAVFLIVMVPAAVLPILLIHVISHTALLPTLLFPLALIFGVGLTRVMRWRRSPFWSAAVLAVILLTGWFTQEGTLLANESRYDARAYVKNLDLASLPPNAVLLTTFDALAVIYSQEYLGTRPDIEVLHFHGRLTRSWLEKTDRPVYTTVIPPPDLDADVIGSGLARRVVLRPSARAPRDSP